METKMPWKRLRHYLGIVLFTVLLSAFFIYQNGLMLDRILVYFILDAVFLAVLLYALESGRLNLKLGKSASNHYDGIAKTYGVFCVIAAGCYFLPEFTFPAAIAAFCLGIAANPETSMGFVLFLCVVLSTAAGGNFYELASYAVLILIGAQMSQTMQKKSCRIWGYVILTASSLCVPALFHYLAYEAGNHLLLVRNGAFALIALYAIHLRLDKLCDKKEHEEWDACEAIIREDYPLVTDIKNYSKAEYVHAIKVATIAKKCAAEIGCNEITVTAAGFYYRLGILEGEPFIENGIRLASQNCFPPSVIQILSEYNGEERLPSSKESAIVHMVDACIKRIEFLNSQNLSSSWNQDMVIYQTLNELSATGIYDESGVSMNQFLKIRELLVREEMGYDSSH